MYSMSAIFQPTLCGRSSKTKINTNIFPNGRMKTAPSDVGVVLPKCVTPRNCIAADIVQCTTISTVRILHGETDSSKNQGIYC